MGNICDAAEDEQDAAELRNLAGLMPSYRRFLSHHSRNCIAGILGDLELLEAKTDASKNPELLNAIYRLRTATKHLMSDLERAGI